MPQTWTFFRLRKGQLSVFFELMDVFTGTLPLSFGRKERDS